MRIAAYQFRISGNINENMEAIGRAVKQAAEQDVELIIFPECALSGYPPHDLPDPESIDFSVISNAMSDLQNLSEKLNINILIGSIAYEGTHYYNRAYLFTPDREKRWYGKKALYGWDEDNFTPGEEEGIFVIGEVKIGVRICFEIRFPEYFRQLYCAKTDLNIVLFYDLSDTDDKERYDLIRSHLRTRAVENVTPFLSVNTTDSYQTAPTCYIDASGKVISELKRCEEGMLIYDYIKRDLNFGEIGRKRYSDELIKY